MIDVTGYTKLICHNSMDIHRLTGTLYFHKSTRHSFDSVKKCLISDATETIFRIRNISNLISFDVTEFAVPQNHNSSTTSIGIFKMASTVKP